MDSNTHSTSAPAGLAALVAELQGLVDQEGVSGLADGALAERVMALRGLLDRLEGHWLQDLADSTAAWLRARLRMSASTAAGLVRTARPCTGDRSPAPPRP